MSLQELLTKTGETPSIERWDSECAVRDRRPVGRVVREDAQGTCTQEQSQDAPADSHRRVARLEAGLPRRQNP